VRKHGPILSAAFQFTSSNLSTVKRCSEKGTRSNKKTMNTKLLLVHSLVRKLTIPYESTEFNIQSRFMNMQRIIWPCYVSVLQWSNVECQSARWMIIVLRSLCHFLIIKLTCQSSTSINFPISPPLRHVIISPLRKSNDGWGFGTANSNLNVWN
jgi:hypothetical protein